MVTRVDALIITSLLSPFREYSFSVLTGRTVLKSTASVERETCLNRISSQEKKTFSLVYFLIVSPLGVFIVVDFSAVVVGGRETPVPKPGKTSAIRLPPPLDSTLHASVEPLVLLSFML